MAQTNEPKKQARKVALISIADYPRDDYSAYWDIDVDDYDPEGDGFAWRATLRSYAPVGWMHDGKQHAARPDVPEPVYPDEIRDEQGRVFTQDLFARLKPSEQLAVMARVEARREECARIYEAHPTPLYVIAENAGIEPTRDEADAAAQSWVIEQMATYKRPAPPTNPQAGYALTLGPLDMIRELFERLFGWLFALGMATTLRNTRLNAVRDAVDAGAGAGLFRIYDGTRPATGGTATTLLAELTHSDPCAPAASAGAATWNAITQDSSANATGTATWFRQVDSTGTFVLDGNVGTAGSDLNLNATSINTGVIVQVTSYVLTEGNA